MQEISGSLSEVIRAYSDHGRWRIFTPHTAERRYSWECIIRTILLALVLKDGQNVRLRKG